MSKTCNNCGNIFDDDANICPRCGTQFIALQAPNPENTEPYEQTPEQPAENNVYSMPPQQPQQQPYGQYQQPQQQPYGQYQQQSYSQPYQPPAEKPMGVGSWLGTILLTNLFGIISLILLFVWAFSSDTPLPKKNYCRAMLILWAIGTVLSIIMIILMVIILTSTGAWDQLIDELRRISIDF